jgi:regulator of replication initiation timing
MVAKHNFPQGLQIGIMAQDIEKQWPQLVRTDKHQQLDTAKAAAPKFDEFKVVNYNGLIPILVKGIQELDATVDSLKALVAENVILKAENEDLKKDVAGIKDMLTKFGDDLQYCCFNQGTNQHTPTGDNNKLEQNNPNPFSENTTIRYYIAAQSKEAVIRISDLNGTVLNTFKIDAKGAGQILLSGNSLKAGTYIYELIVDGKQIDAKRMVLTY